HRDTLELSTTPPACRTPSPRMGITSSFIEAPLRRSGHSTRAELLARWDCTMCHLDWEHSPHPMIRSAKPKIFLGTDLPRASPWVTCSIGLPSIASTKVRHMPDYAR